MDKKKRLKEKIKEYGKEDICVAFSGGVDSSITRYKTMIPFNIL